MHTRVVVPVLAATTMHSMHSYSSSSMHTLARVAGSRRSFRLTARLLLVLLVGLLIEIEFSYYSSTLLLVV